MSAANSPQSFCCPAHICKEQLIIPINFQLLCCSFLPQAVTSAILFLLWVRGRSTVWDSSEDAWVRGPLPHWWAPYVISVFQPLGVQRWLSTLSTTWQAVLMCGHTGSQCAAGDWKPCTENTFIDILKNFLYMSWLYRKSIPVCF